MFSYPRPSDSPWEEDRSTVVSDRINREDDDVRFDEEMGALLRLQMTSGISYYEVLKNKSSLTTEEDVATHGEQAHPTLLILLRILLTQPMVRQTVRCCDTI